MKQRIISAIVAIILLGGVIVASVLYSNLIFMSAMALLGAVATYEVINNAYAIKSKRVIFATVVYSFIMPFVYSGTIPFLTGAFVTVIFIALILAFSISHSEVMSGADMVICASIPLFLGFSFYSIAKLFCSNIFYFLLAVSFAWSCDIFAYFVGVAIGKHHIAPVISPKKTWEGCVGGVLGTAAVTFVMCYVYNHCFSGSANTLFVTMISPLFAIVGMYGDLAASYIKRVNHIKDYGKIMPGHGGVMDRFDSICLISPVLLTLFEMTGTI